MKGIIQRSRGMVHVAVETVLQAEFFNACAQADIFPKRMCRRTEQGLECDLTAAEFRRLRPVLRSCQGRVRIRRRWGWPFLWRRLRRRWGLLLGLGLCLSLLAASSLFLWDIQVTGNERIPTEVILRHLRQCGVGIGSFSPALQPRYLKHEMLLSMDDLSYITINIWGSRAVVEVRERRPVPALRGGEPPANLVAGETGVIRQVLRDEGSVRVQTGQAVLKGELLVSGVVDVGEGGARFVHAAGEVYAETLRAVTVRAEDTVLEKQYTGRTAVRWAVILGERRVNFYFGSGNPFTTCDTIKENIRWSLGDAFPLPVTLVREEYRETALSRRPLEDEEGEKLLSRAAERALDRRTGGGIVVGHESSLSRAGGILQQENFFQVEEDIAREQLLPLPEETPAQPEKETGETTWNGT